MARAKTDAAEAIVLSFADQYTEAALGSMQTGVAIPMEQDARWWALVQQAGGLAYEAVETLVHRSTSSATGAGRPLARYFRDATTYRQHISSQQGDFAVRNAIAAFGVSDRWLM
jgi:3-hydroxy-9,10-secoandrosta-1,3,5(10)-triene-9,17-dione monooxygenase